MIAYWIVMIIIVVGVNFTIVYAKDIEKRFFK